MPTLPNSLINKKPLIDGFSYLAGQNKVEVTSGGVLLSRKRAIKPQDSLGLSFHLNKAELDDFKDFYDNTLDGGTKKFTMTHPIELSEIEVQIVGVPEYSLLGASDYRVGFGVVIVEENN